MCLAYCFMHPNQYTVVSNTHRVYPDSSPGGATDDDRTAEDEYGGFPPQIFSLHGLRHLELCNSAVRHVPDAIRHIRCLSRLQLDFCPLLESISPQAGVLSLRR